MPELPRIPFAWLDAPPAVFGTMIRMSRQAVDRAVAETRLQPLGETLPTLVLGERIAEHACGARVQRRKIAGLEPDRFHRTRERQRCKLLAQQLPQAPGLARRRRQADFNRSRCLFLVEQENCKGAYPCMARGKQPFELNQQPSRGEQQAFGVGDLCRQPELRCEARRRREKFACLGRRTESAVEIVEQGLAATPCQPFT